MHIRLIVIIVLSLITQSPFAQSEMDSIIGAREVVLLEGKVPTFYTPGHKAMALDLHLLITDAIDYYEEKYSKEFAIKLAVLDSASWTHEVIPYGFVYYNEGWIVMNTGMHYATFKEVYGVQDLATQLDKTLAEHGVSPTEMIEAFFKVYSIHELGHHFIEQLSKAESPDNWTNEFSATYFAYEYFKNNAPRFLKPFELFNRVDVDHYDPTYSSIADLNELYAGVGLENYLWYHSNFYFLVEGMYDCYGKDFIAFYEASFPRDRQEELSTDEIIGILDTRCDGFVAGWVRMLEARTE
jgi:hypothetical protein